jgi:hypothetical protein
VKFFVETKAGRVLVGVGSTAKPGQSPDVIWKSGMVGGHPFTFGLVPGTDFDVKLAGANDYAISSHEMRDIGYSTFSVGYKNGNEKEPAGPSKIASITWSGPGGVVSGIEGSHRLTGQILRFDQKASEKLVLRAGTDGRTTLWGEARLRTSSGGGYTTPQQMVTSDASGVAVVSGRYPVERRVTIKGVKGLYVGYDGAPIAAGILPPGASKIGVLLTVGKAASPLVVLQHLPDGRVVFVVKAESAHPSTPSRDAIKAVTWTNADGSKGQAKVTQAVTSRPLDALPSGSK